ncbi:MAG: ABC transporter ATP-binding protein [Lachnospiraceae bacterium]|nr:ABC transporter ATP-binding protein [Lachnospiraceae bacterium]
MIEVKNLVKKYGSHTAVDNLSFTLEPGRIYGFLGPNGAGKSTTMNIITGYLGATSGDVIIDGHNVLDEPEEAKKCIGYLPEIPPLYTDMTVNEYLHFAAKLKKLPKDKSEDFIEQAKEMAHVKDVEGRLIKNLSKGYRQRVGLAYAVLGFPDIIILDEPTVGLDPKQIIEIRDLIKELAKNHTVILSSHILSEVSEVCDYVLIISHGRLVASDTIDNLYKYMGKTSELEIQAKADEGSFRNAIAEVPGINDTECKTEDDFVKATIDYDGKDATLEAVFYALAQSRIPVYEMHKITKSLEELFIELTADTKEAE